MKNAIIGLLATLVIGVSSLSFAGQSYIMSSPKSGLSGRDKAIYNKAQATLMRGVSSGAINNIENMSREELDEKYAKYCKGKYDKLTWKNGKWKCKPSTYKDWQKRTTTKNIEDRKCYVCTRYVENGRSVESQTQCIAKGGKFQTPRGSGWTCRVTSKVYK